ncbi:METTL21B [Symbiodinium sp. CCMP2592]|nr:METTL21B [Symbiodinium sp. CCMP2592]
MAAPDVSASSDPALSSDNVGVASGVAGVLLESGPLSVGPIALEDGEPQLPVASESIPASLEDAQGPGEELPGDVPSQPAEPAREEHLANYDFDEQEELEYYREYDDGFSEALRNLSADAEAEAALDRALHSLVGSEECMSEVTEQVSACSREADPVFVQEQVMNELVRHPVPPRGFQLPWERGPMKSIFADNLPSLPSLKGMPRRSMPEPPPAVIAPSLSPAAKLPSPSEPIFKLVVKVVKDVGYLERREELLQVGIHKLAINLELVGNAFVPPELLHQGQVDAESLEAAIGVRSPLTLNKRVGNLANYLKWCMESCVESGCYLHEATVWKYLSHLRHSGSPPSRGADCVSMFRFLHHVLGLDLTHILKSRRVSGITEPMRTGKGWIKQASPLTVSEILFLHRLLEQRELHKYDLAMVAYILLALYARARHSDLADVQNVTHDHSPDGFVWGTGATVHGGVHAVRTNMRSFPLVTQMLASYAKQWVQDHPFTSLMLFADVQAPLHADRNNAAGVDNFLIGLTGFSHGELWVESSSGSQVCPDPAYPGCGELLPVSRTCAFFDAHARHATCPWTGHRVVLAGFTVKGYDAFGQAMRAELTSLGFQMPQLAAALPLLADLLTPEGRELCRFWLQSPLLVAVFASPPCDASSHEALHEFLSEVVEECQRRRVLCAIENPQRSSYWDTSAFRRIQHLCAHTVSLDQCAFGGSQPKRTTIVSTSPCFASLAKDCPGKACAAHHAADQETAYPPKLAASIAHALACCRHDRTVVSLPAL